MLLPEAYANKNNFSVAWATLLQHNQTACALRPRNCLHTMGNRQSRKGRAGEAADKAPLVASPSDNPRDAPPAYTGETLADAEKLTSIVKGVKLRMDRAQQHGFQSQKVQTVFTEFALLLMGQIIKRPKTCPLNVFEQEAVIRLVILQFDGLGHAQYVMNTPTQGYWVSKKDMIGFKRNPQEAGIMTLALRELTTLKCQLHGMGGFNVDPKARDTADQMIAILQHCGYEFISTDEFKRRSEVAAGIVWLEARVSEM